MISTLVAAKRKDERDRRIMARCLMRPSVANHIHSHMRRQLGRPPAQARAKGDRSSPVRLRPIVCSDEESASEGLPELACAVSFVTMGRRVFPDNASGGEIG